MDSCGRVIGMVAAGINAPAVENIGLAIPASVLRPIVAEIIETGRVARAWHGLYGQIVSPPILLMLGVPEWDWESTKGFLVETVEPGSAAARVGLRGGTLPVRWGGMEILLGGDIITHVNGKHIETRDQALDVIRGLKPGDRVDLVYLRDGERMEASVDVEERPVLEGDLDMYRYSDRE